MYSEGTEKLQFIQEICSKLNQKGFTDLTHWGEEIQFTPGKGMMAGMVNLPKENLQKMTEIDISECNKFKEAYDLWGKAGCLRFEPYVLRSKDNPTLCLRHSTYIHMFRGYYFQASGTPEGIVDGGHGSYRTDILTTRRDYSCGFRYTKIYYMLWWAALLDTGFNFANFMELFLNNPLKIEYFLHKSMWYWHCEPMFMWEDVNNNISVEIGGHIPNDRNAYQIKDKYGVVCRFSMGNKTICVETYDKDYENSKLLTLRIPSLTEIPKSGEWNQSYTDEIEEYEEDIYEALNSMHYIEMLTVMALKLCRVNINFMVWYTLNLPGEKKLGTIKEPRSKGNTTDIETLNDIYGAKPDEF